ncbi:MAG TPA: hypothetical protein VG672_03840, partial [Bryobacteraceae bacterium]|nr:hypothetical protein [Bryobacteraceae bacterium]
MRGSLLVLFLALVVAAPAQYYPRTRRGPNSTLNAGAYGGPAVTLHGKLKQITNKEIVVESEEEQVIVLRRNRKTKFLKGDQEIKPADIPAGTQLSLDVTKDPEMKPLALNVFVE